MIYMILYDGFWLFIMVCVFEMFGGCDWDLRRFFLSEVLKELLRQKWADSFFRCFSMSWGQISDHPKRELWAWSQQWIASFDLSGSEGETQLLITVALRAAEWVFFFLGIPESEWLTVTYRDHWNDMNRRRWLVKFTLDTRLLQAMSVGCFYIFYPNLHHLASWARLVGHKKKSCVCSFAPLTRGKLSRTFFHHEFWQLENYVCVCVINDNIWKKWKVNVQVFVPKQQHVAALLLNRRFGFPSASASHATRFVCGQHPPLRARRT